jgi:hypothetical protein
MKIINFMSMLSIGSSNHDKQHVFSLTLEEVFFENKPLASLVVHLHPCFYDERKNLEYLGRKGM